jgi:spore germination cell wall hydrolase CwlJ-like protein
MKCFRNGGRAAALLAFASLWTNPSTAAGFQLTGTNGHRVSVSFPVGAPAEASLPTVKVPRRKAIKIAAFEPGPALPAPSYEGAIAAAVAAAAQQPASLSDMVATYAAGVAQDAEQLCLAKAVYFEARGESLEGQLAVAEVVLNRAASGLYPGTLCKVVTQPAQFSFIRAGRFPAVRMNDECWRKAQAIADIARKGLVRQMSANVLWYHASYVAPSWGRRLTRSAKIGAHIFYS